MMMKLLLNYGGNFMYQNYDKAVDKINKHLIKKPFFKICYLQSFKLLSFLQAIPGCKTISVFTWHGAKMVER